MKYPYLLAIAVAAAGTSPGFSQTAVPIENNSFETPVGSSTYIGAPFGVTPNPTYVTGWTTTDASGGDAYSVKTTADTGVTGANGSQTIEDFNFPDSGSTPANGGGSVYQVENGMLGTTATSYGLGTYTLTALAGSAYTGGTTAAETNDSFYFANSATPTTPFKSTTIVAGPNFTLSTFTVVLDNTSGTLTGPIVIGFQSPGNPTQSNMEIDDFSLTFTPAAVPEPNSIAIAALGGFTLLGGFLRRRRA